MNYDYKKVNLGKTLNGNIQPLDIYSNTDQSIQYYDRLMMH